MLSIYRIENRVILSISESPYVLQLVCRSARQESESPGNDLLNHLSCRSFQRQGCLKIRKGIGQGIFSPPHKPLRQEATAFSRIHVIPLSGHSLGPFWTENIQMSLTYSKIKNYHFIVKLIGTNLTMKTNCKTEFGYKEEVKMTQKICVLNWSFKIISNL